MNTFYQFPGGGLHISYLDNTDTKVMKTLHSIQTTEKSVSFSSLSPWCQISLLVKPLDFVPVGGFHWLPSVYTVEKATVEVPKWDVVCLMAFVIVSL